MSIISASVLTRRRTVNSAAWSLPVITAAVAAPAGAAMSSNYPPTEHWGISETVSVASGNVVCYSIFGTDAHAKPAELPSDSSIVVAAEPGVSLELVDSDGFEAKAMEDGSIVAIIHSVNRTLASLYFRPIGKSGQGYTITAEVDIEPYSNVKKILIL